MRAKTSATYTPVADDVGKFLLVTATYTDRKTNAATDDTTTANVDETKDQARVASANAVQGPDTNNKPPKFPDIGPQHRWRPEGPNEGGCGEYCRWRECGHSGYGCGL